MAAQRMRDVLRFAMENKAFWVVPLVLGLVAVIALVVASRTPVAPFVYSLF